MKKIPITMNLSPNFQNAFSNELKDWESNNKIRRLWSGDKSLWSNDDEDKWLGWLTPSLFNIAEVDRINVFAEEIKNEFDDIVVLGMGGSSLFPDMIAKTFNIPDDYPRLHVLDSTDPLQIQLLEKEINLKKTLFIISSKSGTTLESVVLKDYFYSRLLSMTNHQEVGKQFIAITDPHSSLEVMAKQQQFRTLFHGIPSIGGRYSALSNFGMVPLGLVGINIKEFLNNANEMISACLSSVPVKENPAFILGAIMGIGAKQGKDKLTLILPPSIENLGAWIEQLIAESTGKNGQGIIPVDLEHLSTNSAYGKDRLFVCLQVGSSPDTHQAQRIYDLQKAGYEFICLTVPDVMHLGAQLFLWELATAVAASILQVNPFNQPDVEASKKRSLQLTSEYEHSGKVSVPNLIISEGNTKLYGNGSFPKTANTVAACLSSYLAQIKEIDYVTLSAFIPMTNKNITLLQKIRTLIRDRKQVATCLGFGPRFLHSTGQLHKGGPNNGVFLQITAKHTEDIPIPNRPYTFGLLIDLQAQGDFDILVARSRRILRIHLERNITDELENIYLLLKNSTF